MTSGPSARASVTPPTPSLASLTWCPCDSRSSRSDSRRPHLGPNAPSRVRHAQHGATGLTGDVDLDGTTRRRVLDGVLKKVADDLLKARQIGAHHHGLGSHGDAMLEPLPAVPEQTNAVGGHLTEIEWLATQRDLAGGDARDVQQVVHQVGEMVRLTEDDLAGAT